MLLTEMDLFSFLSTQTIHTANYLQFTDGGGTDATVGTSDFLYRVLVDALSRGGSTAFLTFLTVGGDGGSGGLRCYIRGGGYTGTY